MDIQDYSVRFNHDVENEITTCTVVTVGVKNKDLRPDNIFGVGTAKCGDSDIFCKRVGRKLSMTRAIKDLPRADRQVIWAGYKENAKL
jgi:hypothetical protein